MAATAQFDRTRAFMDAYRLRIPVLLAPMAGARSLGRGCRPDLP